MADIHGNICILSITQHAPRTVCVWTVHEERVGYWLRENGIHRVLHLSIAKILFMLMYLRDSHHSFHFALRVNDCGQKWYSVLSASQCWSIWMLSEAELDHTHRAHPSHGKLCHFRGRTLFDLIVPSLSHYHGMNAVLDLVWFQCWQFARICKLYNNFIRKDKSKPGKINPYNMHTLPLDMQQMAINVYTSPKRAILKIQAYGSFDKDLLNG